MFLQTAAVRWKNNKIVNALSTFIWKEPIQYVKRSCKKQNKQADIEKPYIKYIYMQQIIGGMWPHGPEYCHIHDQLSTKEVVLAPF